MTIPQQTAWEGEYKIEGDSLDLWRRCRIVDISNEGAEIKFLDAIPERTHGRPITIAVKLHGEVQASELGADCIRVEFVELTAKERKTFESLAKSQVDR